MDRFSGSVLIAKSGGIERVVAAVIVNGNEWARINIEVEGSPIGTTEVRIEPIGVVAGSRGRAGTKKISCGIDVECHWCRCIPIELIKTVIHDRLECITNDVATYFRRSEERRVGKECRSRW